MNEQRLIDWMRRRTKKGGGLVVGIGDDAALVRIDGGKSWLLATDMIVEGVHFNVNASRAEDWGSKAILCNISDIAAMGGIPRFALVSMGLPSSCTLQQAKRIMKGAQKACKRFGVQIAGGDTSRSECIVLSVAMVGEIKFGRCVCRGGAKPGDTIFVTGPVGGSLRSRRHLEFRPKLHESQFLVRNYEVHSMIDLSDGLSTDLGHIAKESQVGLRLFEALIPLHPDAHGIRSAFTDGEDFELAFTLGSKESLRLLQDRRCRRRGFTFYPIGRVVARKMGCAVLDSEGQTQPFPPRRDHHFSN